MYKIIAAICLFAGILSSSTPVAKAETLYGVSSSDFLVSFESTTPNIVDFIDPITGLQPGQTVASLSFNSALNALFALGVNSQGKGNLYELNLSNGVATVFDPCTLLPVSTSPTTQFTSSATGLQYLATTSDGVTDLFVVDPPTPSLVSLGAFANGAESLSAVAAVPEPTALPMLLVGLGGLVLCFRAKAFRLIGAGA